jgi:hypothetical protein
MYGPFHPFVLYSIVSERYKSMKSPKTEQERDNLLDEAFMVEPRFLPTTQNKKANQTLEPELALELISGVVGVRARFIALGLGFYRVRVRARARARERDWVRFRARVRVRPLSRFLIL